MKTHDNTPGKLFYMKHFSRGIVYYRTTKDYTFNPTIYIPRKVYKRAVFKTMRLCAKLTSFVLVAKNMIADSGFYASGPNPFTGCCFRIPIIQTTIGWVSTLHGFHGRLIGSLVGPHIILTIVYTGKSIFLKYNTGQCIGKLTVL